MLPDLLRSWVTHPLLVSFASEEVVVANGVSQAVEAVQARWANQHDTQT